MESRARIGMLVGRFHPYEGGAEIQCKRLSQELIAQNLTVFVLTPKLPRLPDNELIDGLPVYRIGLSWPGKLGSLAYFLSGFLWLIKNRATYDILHAHIISAPALLASLAGAIIGKPTIVKVAGSRATGDIALSSLTWHGRLKLGIVRKLARSVVCPSQEIRDELIAYGFPASKIRVIPNGVPTDVFYPVSHEVKMHVRTQLGLPLNATIVLYAGRLESGKGIELLINAWRELKSIEPSRNSILVILGKGTQLPELKQKASGCPSVRFPGWVNSTVHYLQASDVFVLPSLGEGMSNALAEAMASGLSCIASNIGGTRDLINDDSCGILYSSDNPTGLVDALKSAISKPASAGMAARKRIEEYFALSTIARHYDNLYRDIRK